MRRGSLDLRRQTTLTNTLLQSAFTIGACLFQVPKSPRCPFPLIHSTSSGLLAPSVFAIDEEEEPGALATGEIAHRLVRVGLLTSDETAPQKMRGDFLGVKRERKEEQAD